jgi:hypothetical protein
MLTAVLAIAAHAVLRRPAAACPDVVVGPGGLWSVPAEGLAEAALGPRTRYTQYWVRLEVQAATGSRILVLTRDQLDAGAWRELQSALRRWRHAPRADGPKDWPTVLR